RRVELVLELVARAAATAAFRATALDHEVGDHAMERQAIVIAALRQIDEVGHRDRCLVFVQAQVDRAAVGGEGDMDGHRKSLGSEAATCHDSGTRVAKNNPADHGNHAAMTCTSYLASPFALSVAQRTWGAAMDGRSFEERGSRRATLRLRPCVPTLRANGYGRF